MKSLIIYKKPGFKTSRMVISFSGWMDGGGISTGTVKYLRDKLKARKLARIEPEGFYIFNLPGTMEQVAQFRPYAEIKDGILIDFQYPENQFFYDDKNSLILFLGKEPNIRWNEYAHCLFQLIEKFGTREIYFIGSVAGPVPHTREPRISCSVSSEKQKTKLQEYDVRFTNYKGPASITTLLTKLTKDRGIDMVNLVAEIPMYVQTENPKGMEAIVKRLIGLLGIDIDLSDLYRMSNEFENNINDAVARQPKLADLVKKLEKDYDKEFFGQKEDFEEWLKKQGIDKL